MEISRQSKLLRWAYLLSDKNPSRWDDTVFWRAIVLTPLKLALIFVRWEATAEWLRAKKQGYCPVIKLKP